MASLSAEKLPHSIIAVSLLTKLAEEYGLPYLPLLEEAGIDKNKIDDPKAKIWGDQDMRFVSALLAQIKDPEISFRAAKYFKLSAFGYFGLGTVSCATVGDAVRFFLKYIKLAFTHFDVSFSTIEGKAILRFTEQYNLGELKQFYLERDFAIVMISTKEMFPRSFEHQKFKAVHFDFECPTTVAAYESFYGCPVFFSMPHNEIQFDETYLNRELPHANPLTHKLLEEQCESQKLELLGPDSFSEVIEKAIYSYDKQLPNLDDISRSFHMTPRTIRRKLEAEGTSFQKLANEVLCKKAVYFLENTNLTVEEIADRLGYSESAGFIHAIKRWTGKSPKQIRTSVI